MKSCLPLTGAIALLLIAGSCRKSEPPYGEHTGNAPIRKVRFELFTNENFSGDKKTIHFNLYMRAIQRSVFDSALATMKIEEIPDSLHKMVIERAVPYNDTATLAVGFTYAIDGVGVSWYQELFPAGDTIKLLKFPFK